MDTMDFVKRAWATLDLSSLSSPFTPTLSVEELDKRIADLRAVEQWLALNQGMLRNTIQGLEIQRGTLAAVQNLTDSFGRISWPPGEETAEALARFAAATILPPQAPEPAQPPSSPQPSWTSSASPSPAVPANAPAPAASIAAHEKPDAAAEGDATPQQPAWGVGVDPLAWWRMLQTNFEQIARMASGPPGADAAASAGAETPAARRSTSAKARSKAGAKSPAGTKPAPRRKGSQAANGKTATAGPSADAKSREER
jgi:hypothetical protein